MEITPSLTYWITRLDNINFFGAIFGTVFGFGLILSIVALCITYLDATCDDDDKKNARHILCWIIPFFIIFNSIWIFIPSTKEMAAIIVIPKIANSEKIQNIGNEFYELALDWMKELRPQNIKKD